MTIASKLRAILDVVQNDVCRRGLAPNLFAAYPDDFAAACHSVAEHPASIVGVVTGFWIPSAQRGETDGPLGAAYLARTLPQLGVGVRLFTDDFCLPALRAALSWTRIEPESTATPPRGLTHLVALERVGPNQEGRCQTMRGIDITDHMTDVSAWFEASGGREPPENDAARDRVFPRGAHAPRSPAESKLVTIGIGDGGNEIGMGKLAPAVIVDNILHGERIACRVATDYLLVVGISNWGAYALANGIAVVRGVQPTDDWFDLEREHAILRAMVEQGPLVDGMSGEVTDKVDGLAYSNYCEPLRRIGQILRQ